MKLNSTIILLMLLFTISCSTQSTTENTNILKKNTVVAITPNLEITLQDVDNFIISLPAINRWDEHNTKSWYKNIIRNTLLEKFINQQITSNAVKQTQLYLRNAQAIERIAFSDQYLAGKIVDNIPAQDLLKYYNDNQDKYNFPEQRIVHHIYKKTKNNEVDSLGFLKEIQQRVIAGENFKLLAEQYSDSETKFKQGYLGIFTKKSKPYLIADIVYDLELGVPSKPVKISNGYHLFYVSEIIRASEYPFSEVKNSIAKKLLSDLYKTTLRNLAMELITSSSMIIASDNDLKTIIKNNTPNTIIIKVGDFELSYQQIKTELIIHTEKSGLLTTAEITNELLQNMAYREVIYQTMKSNNKEISRINMIDDLKHQLAISISKDKIIDNYIKNNPQLIEEYFNKYHKRFYAPMLLSIQILTIPYQPKSGLVEYLNGFIQAVNNKQAQLEDLDPSINANIENIGPISSTRLNSYDKNILNHALRLNLNQYSRPFMSQNKYHIIQLTNKIVGKPQSFLLVKDQVTLDYKTKNSKQILKQIFQEVIDEITFKEEIIENFIRDPTVLMY